MLENGERRRENGERRREEVGNAESDGSCVNAESDGACVTLLLTALAMFQV